MKRYMIERDIPGIGAMSPADLGGPAKASNKAIAENRRRRPVAAQLCRGRQDLLRLSRKGRSRDSSACQVERDSVVPNYPSGANHRSADRPDMKGEIETPLTQGRENS